MKRATFLLLVAVVAGLSSCASYHRIGDLTIIGTRNIDSKTDYVEVKRYVEGKGPNIEVAVNDAVKRTNGGDYLKNVQIYTNGKKFKVVGDVWGLNTTRAYNNQTQPAPQYVAAVQPQQVAVTQSQPVTTTQPAHTATNVFSVGDRVSFQRKLVDKNLTAGEITGIDANKALIKFEIKGKSYTERVAVEKLTKVQ